MSWVRFPVRLMFVAPKLSITEKRHQDQSCVFRTGVYRNKGYNTEKCSGFESQWRWFCSSKSEHGRRTVPRPKLFVPASRLQEERPQPRKSYLGSFPGEMVSITRKLSTMEEWRQGQTSLFRQWHYKNKGHNPENVSWVRVPVKMVSVARKLTWQKKAPEERCFWTGILQEQWPQPPKNSPGYESRWS
jgi:hypothetical protein